MSTSSTKSFSELGVYFRGFLKICSLFIPTDYVTLLLKFHIRVFFAIKQDFKNRIYENILLYYHIYFLNLIFLWINILLSDAEIRNENFLLNLSLFGINLTVSRIKFDAKFCRDIVYYPYGHPYLYVNIHIRQLDDNNIVKEFSKWAQ